MLTERMYRIVKVLEQNENRYMSSIELADKVEVSNRTIKRDIKLINEILENYEAVIQSSKAGYILEINDIKKYKSIINQDKEQINNYDKLYKINRVIELMLTNVYISQNQLADEMYISRSTIGKNIYKVKEELSKYNIKIGNKPHYGYYIEGSEVDIRNCMVKYILKRKDKGIEIINKIQPISNEDYKQIRRYITDKIKSNGIIKTDTEIEYICMYIIVSSCRTKLGFDMELKEEANISIDTKILQISKEMVKRIENVFNICLKIDDVIYISYIIGNSYKESELSTQTDEKSHKDFYKSIVSDFFYTIKNTYGVDFSSDEILRKGLVNHLHASYTRYYLSATIANPLVPIIKSKYIEAYNYSVLCGSVLKNNYNLKIIEDDIGYIALHFAAALERNASKYKYKVIVVCSNGIGTSELIKTRISKEISNVDVVGIYPSYMLENLDLGNIDMVLTTIDLEKDNLDKPVLKISPLLLDEDISKIDQILNKYKEFEYLKTLIKKDLFFYNVDIESKDELMEYVTSNMVKQGWINDKIKQAIIDRENISSTEINKLVAIPHSITDVDNKESVISAVILKRPIEWKEDRVQIVFIAAIDPKVQINKKVFQMIYKLTNTPEKVNKLVEVKDYENFIEVFDKLMINK